MVPNRFLDFIENTLLGKITRSIIHEKTSPAVLPFLPKLILRVDHNRRDNLMQAFTFSDYKPESPLKLACISIVRDMIIPNGDILCFNASDLAVYNYQSDWVNKLPSLLNQLGNKHPVSTQAVLQLFLDLGCVGCLNASPHLKKTLETSSCLVKAKVHFLLENRKACYEIWVYVHAAKLESAIECDEQEIYCGTLKALTNLVLKPALENGCAILRMICTLDTKPTRLSESSVTTLSEFLPVYLIDTVNCIPEDKENSYHYLEPCFLLFDRSSKLTEQVMKIMRLLVSEYTKALELVQDRESGQKSLNLIQCIVSVILLMHSYVKVRKIIPSSKSEINLILQNVITLQSSRGTSLTVEGKHMMKIARERIRLGSKSLLALSYATVTTYSDFSSLP